MLTESPMAEAANELCIMWVGDPPHYIRWRLCARPVKGVRHGVGVCGIHMRARQGAYCALEGPEDHTWLPAVDDEGAE